MGRRNFVFVSIAAVLPALLSAGIPVAQFREEPQDLEDAFLSVTRHDQPPTANAEAAQ